MKPGLISRLAKLVMANAAQGAASYARLLASIVPLRVLAEDRVMIRINGL
jgi:hypothetical protein